jgi:hypothetical protein
MDTHSDPEYQAELEDDWDTYRRIWHAVLTNLLGMKKSAVKEFTESCRWFAFEPGVCRWFAHDFPEQYIEPLLLSAGGIFTRDPNVTLKLGREIGGVLRFGQACQSYDASYDWSAARQRVEKVLNEYGGSLEGKKRMRRVRTRIAVTGFTKAEAAVGIPCILEEFRHGPWYLAFNAEWFEGESKLIVSVDSWGNSLEVQGGITGAILDEVRDCVIACVDFSSEGISFEIEDSRFVDAEDDPATEQ